MAKIRTIQIYRGTKAQNDAYTGSVGELTMDTDNNDVRIHDGSTLGGHPIGFHPYLFYHEWADYEVSDTNWLRADTFSWQDGSVYEAAYNHLADDISGKSLSSETVAGVTVQFYLADDEHKICPASEESNVSAIYSATGVAWYYILDTVNQRFKLPRTKYGFTGLRDTVGKYVPESLPNITGAFSDFTRGDIYATYGAFNHTMRADGRLMQITGNTAGWADTTFNASRSSSTYQDNAPVQERATQMYLYFYVGEFTQSALENTAGLNAELFNGKADIDLDNLSSTGKATVANLAMPSGTYDDLTVGSDSSIYTAPANGCIFWGANGSSSSGYISIWALTPNADSNWRNDATQRLYCVQTKIDNTNGNSMALFLSKGNKFGISYSNVSSSWLFRFVYAQGEAN